MKPEISIIVPVYNAERTLARCLDSVLEQSFRDYELILIDDGSRDGSGPVCDRYAALDSRIRVIHQENAGVSAARNAGLALAEGNYIMFLDSDDCFLPGHLEAYCEAAAGYGCDIVVGGFTRVDGGEARACLPGQTGCFGGEIWEEICREPVIYGYLWNKLFRGDLLRANRLMLCSAMYSQEDLDFCLSAFAAAEKVALIPANTYRYDYAPGKRTPPYWDFLANQLKMLRLGARKTALSPKARDCVHRRILSLLYAGLYAAADEGNFDEMVRRLAGVEGLGVLLASIDAEGEHGFVARNFSAGRYGRLGRYFRLRRMLRNGVRTLLRRKPETR